MMHVSELSDDLLEHCFSFLPRTCRRWHAVAHRPELLRKAFAHVPNPQSLASFQSWLIRHKASVSGLQIVPGKEALEPQAATNGWTALAAALGAAGGSLTALQLWFTQGPFHSNVDSGWPGVQWMRALPALEVLSIGHGGPIGPGLGSLRRLRSMCISGEVRFTPDAELPPGLTRLEMNWLHNDVLPRQFSTLRHLASLQLDWWASEGGQPDGTEVLAAMTALTKLCMWRASYNRQPRGPDVVPPELRLLTGLRFLRLSEFNSEGTQDVSGQLDALLGPDHQLETLLLDQVQAWRLPGCLSRLSRLSTLWFLAEDEQGNRLVTQESGKTALPPGPWLARLQRMAVPALVVLANVPQLAQQAQQLQQLRLLTHASLADGRLCQLVLPPTHLPALTRLVVMNMQEWDGSEIVDRLTAVEARALADLEAARPSLWVRLPKEWGEHTGRYRPFLQQEYDDESDGDSEAGSEPDFDWW